MEYIGEGCTLPVPLNILGGPRALVNKIIKVCCCCKSADDVRETPDEVSGSKIDPDHSNTNGTSSGVRDVFCEFHSMENHLYFMVIQSVLTFQSAA